MDREGRSGSGQRLALLLPDMGGGGAERVALALMNGFLSRGYSVDLLLSAARGELLDAVSPEVELFDLKASRLRDALPALVRYLKARRPHALHAMMWPMPALALLARAMARSDTRIVAAEHTMLSAMPHGLRYRGVRALTRQLYLRADRIVAVSNGVADDLSEFLRLPRNQISVIHNPLTLPDELPAADHLADQWPPAKIRLLAVGELKSEKNYPVMLEALRRLRQDVDASLVILGFGDLTDDMKVLARAKGVEEFVSFAGYKGDPWPYYTSANLLVLSSDHEGLPTVLIEALHAGLPIVSTDCRSGPREILDAGTFGTLVPVGDAAALADGIRVALGRQDDPRALRGRAAALSGGPALDRHLEAMLNS